MNVIPYQLPNFPKELWIKILLDVKDTRSLFRLRRVCRLLNSIISDIHNFLIMHPKTLVHHLKEIDCHIKPILKIAQPAPASAANRYIFSLARFSVGVLVAISMYYSYPHVPEGLFPGQVLISLVFVAFINNFLLDEKRYGRQHISIEDRTKDLTKQLNRARNLPSLASQRSLLTTRMNFFTASIKSANKHPEVLSTGGFISLPCIELAPRASRNANSMMRDIERIWDFPVPLKWYTENLSKENLSKDNHQMRR